VVSVAPAAAVISVFGGGGIYDTDGLRAASMAASHIATRKPVHCTSGFGVPVTHRAFETQSAKGGVTVEIVQQPPPAAIAVWSTRVRRSRRQRRADALSRMQQASAKK
jgi:hypothetical protein